MNKYLSALSALAFTVLSAAPALAADTYTFDPSHTAVTFHINHFGFSNPSGKFMSVTGSVTLDQQNPAASKVEATIGIAGVNTGVAKLDEHVKTPDFFDAAKFPEAKFTSTKVEVTGEKTAKVTGDLTLHGVTKPVILDVTLNQVGPNMMKKQTAGFTASTTIKRSEFGMSTYVPNLADDVRIDIEAEANVN